MLMENQTQQKPLTFGEKLVVLTHNVGGRADINFAKRQFAMVADFLENTVNTAARQFHERRHQFMQEATHLAQQEFSALPEEEQERRRQSGQTLVMPDLPQELKDEQDALSWMQIERDEAHKRIKDASMWTVGSLTRLPEVK